VRPPNFYLKILLFSSFSVFLPVILLLFQQKEIDELFGVFDRNLYLCHFKRENIKLTNS